MLNLSKTQFKRLLKISRPKFWHYTAGPFALGTIPFLKQNPNQIFIFLPIFFWFLIFGNFFIYGVNDLYDQDTDAHNSKKDNQDEIKLQKSEQNLLKISLLISLALGLPLAFINPLTTLFFVSFLLFSWQYSAPPIRAKSRPIIDGIFNVLYVLPATIPFAINANFPPLNAFLAATLWCMAMHAFSAIPDISADKKVNLLTTAVLLGHKGTLIYCLACYFLAILILPITTIFLIPYIIILTILIFQKPESTSKFYPYFPIINLLIGMLLFFYLVI